MIKLNKKYVVNISWLSLEKVFRVLESFIITIWLTKYLSISDFGVFSYSLSFVYLFSSIASLGLDQIVIKKIVDYPNKRDQILGTSFFLKLLGFCIMFFLLWVTLNSISSDNYSKRIVLIIGTAVLFHSFNGIDFYFQSQIKSKYSVYVNIFVIIVASLIKIYLIVFSYPLVFFAYTVIVESLLIAIGYVFCYQYLKLSIRKWNFNLKTAKQLLSKSWTLIFGSIAASLYMKIDQVMIKELIDERSTGIYAVAVKLSNIWLFVTLIITQSVFPKLVLLKRKNQQIYIKRLQQLYDFLLKIAILGSIMFTFFSKNIIILFFEEKYIESSEILVIYVWSIVFVFLSNASWGFYLNEKLEKLSSIRLIIGALINIILNIILIKQYGLFGAAYSTLISYFISGYLINLFFKKTRQNFWLQSKSFINFFNYKTWINPLK